ncbi:tyrosine-type recombinase/integrase [Nonomuraea turkmeniaca]|uniref:tyrosine-type recombinase/integrase n=1 Tax=Nonomuraea turkmeniaca TaxID=103838 RepID=UPI0024825C3B|nr:tyrosine-type recombinase/integrase [Nonomuraea turkmeniaca]
MPSPSTGSRIRQVAGTGNVTARFSPLTLHQLRHSALTHAAEDGANTSTPLAYSGHTSVASLARYARVSPEALARWQEGRGPGCPTSVTSTP